MLIVGAGLAGAKAAEGAREAGWNNRIVLVGDVARLDATTRTAELGGGTHLACDAAMHLNDWDTVETLEAIVAAGEPIDTDLLADPGGTLRRAVSDHAGGRRRASRTRTGWKASVRRRRGW